MVRCLRLFVVTIALSALAACGPPMHPINPPNASIQQLNVMPDGRWKLQIRLENLSDKTVHYAAFKATLKVAGVATPDIALNPDMDIPGDNADIVETTLAPGADALQAFARTAREPGGVPYELSGTINIPAAGKDFKFEHRSRLSPVPGIADQYR
jgi:hypothetical protein